MSSYWDLIQETKVQVELGKDEELSNINSEEDKVAKEASDFLESQLFMLHMEDAEPEEPVYELQEDHMSKEDPTHSSARKAQRAIAHGTAEVIVEFPFEGWDLKSLTGKDGRDLAYMLEIISKGGSLCLASPCTMVCVPGAWMVYGTIYLHVYPGRPNLLSSGGKGLIPVICQCGWLYICMAKSVVSVPCRSAVHYSALLPNKPLLRR